MMRTEPVIVGHGLASFAAADDVPPEDLPDDASLALPSPAPAAGPGTVPAARPARRFGRWPILLSVLTHVAVAAAAMQAMPPASLEAQPDEIRVEILVEAALTPLATGTMQEASQDAFEVAVLAPAPERASAARPELAVVADALPAAKPRTEHAIPAVAPEVTPVAQADAVVADAAKAFADVADAQPANAVLPVETQDSVDHVAIDVAVPIQPLAATDPNAAMAVEAVVPSGSVAVASVAALPVPVPLPIDPMPGAAGSVAEPVTLAALPDAATIPVPVARPHSVAPAHGADDPKQRSDAKQAPRKADASRPRKAAAPPKAAAAKDKPEAGRSTGDARKPTQAAAAGERASKRKDGQSAKAGGKPETKQGGKAAGPAAQAAYSKKLLSHVQRHKRYPAAAQKQRLAGSSRLQITIDRGGRLVGARLAASSGQKLLDAEALAAAKRAAPYPRPPDGVGGGTLTFAVTFRFGR